MTFQQKLNTFTPILCRILARDSSGSILSDEQIAKASGLWIVQVRTIQLQTSWHGIDMPTAFAYLKGCGIDLESRSYMNQIATYMRGRATFAYLRRDPEWTNRWLPYLIQWRRCHHKNAKHPWPPMQRLLNRTAMMV